MSLFLQACADDDGGLLSVLGTHLTGMTKAQLKSRSGPARAVGLEEKKKVRLRSVCLPYGITQCSSFLSQGFSIPQKRLKQLKARKFMHTSITQDNTL